MKKAALPVYDLPSIDRQAGNGLLIERFAPYLEKHYAELHRTHRHSFYHLVLFTEGKGHHTLDFTRFEVQPYQIYFMVPGQVHSWHFEAGVDGYLVHFEPSLFSSFLLDPHYLDRFSFFSGHSTDSVIQLPKELQARSKQVFEDLLLEAQAARWQNIDQIRIRLIELFILVERIAVPDESPVNGRPGGQVIRSFRHLIEKNYRDLRLPKEYAELLYITPNHLNALCQELLGRTAGELIRERVILEAKRLLTNRALTVTEIAYELRFEDNSYFNRFFRKSTGMTPETFRKSVLDKS